MHVRHTYSDWIRACVAAASLAIGGARADDAELAVALRQIALDQAGFGVGFVDNKDGGRTEGALADFVRSRGVSRQTALKLLGAQRDRAFTTYTVTAADLAEVGEAPEDWVEAAAVTRMACTTLAEALSEKFHASPAFLQRLNPQVGAWDAALAGAVLTVPNITLKPTTTRDMVARLEIDCTRFRLRVFSRSGQLAASFPCSCATDVARIPRQPLKVVAFAKDPNYTFDPANFRESPRAREIGRKLLIPPGPNNPVGVYWMSLSAPGFGIHGTPHPETIGRRESHGCFRLTNWDIVRVIQMTPTGTPIQAVAIPAE